jgi:DNA-binding transcriptional LysR family regulator
MRKKTLDYNLLATFTAVAEEKSFSKAAILQPATLQRWGLAADDVRFVSDDFALLRELASEGAGVTFIPDYLAASYVHRGRLERISITGRTLTLPVVMVYPSRGQVSRKVIAFRDFLVEWLQKTGLG